LKDGSASGKALNDPARSREANVKAMASYRLTSQSSVISNKIVKRILYSAPLLVSKTLKFQLPSMFVWQSKINVSVPQCR
jgi:hypothetical protein